MSLNKKELRSWLLDRLSQPVLQRFKRLYLTQNSFDEVRESWCQGCGRPKKNPTPYLGQTFCEECVETWDPQRKMRQLREIAKGFKWDLKKFFTR